MLRHYYVSLTGVHSGEYVDVRCDGKHTAERIAVRQFGIMNVSTVYPASSFGNTMLARSLEYVGEIYDSTGNPYREKKKL